MSIHRAVVESLKLPSPGPESSLRTATVRLALPRVLLCDLDGTLIDSMPTLADLATEVMGEVFGTPAALARELYIATCGLPFIRQLEAVFQGDPRNAHASELFEARKPGRCDQIRMSIEVTRALAEMRARGVLIAVSSNNGTANVETFARNSAFPFDLVLGFGGGLSKGRPHIERAEAVFGIDRSQMLFIGDSLHDGEIAANEGLDFVGIAGTFSHERFARRFPNVSVVLRFADVPRLFEASRPARWPLHGSLAVAGG